MNRDAKTLLVLEALDGSEPMTITQISDATGVARSLVDSYLHNYAKTSIVERAGWVPGGRNKQSVLFRLTKVGWHFVNYRRGVTPRVIRREEPEELSPDGILASARKQPNSVFAMGVA